MPAFLLLAAFVLAANPAAAETAFASKDGGFRLLAPDGWAEALPIVGDDNGDPVLCLQGPGPGTALNVYPIDGPLSGDALTEFARGRADNRRAWGQQVGRVQIWRSPGGLSISYFLSRTATGDLVEGAFNLGDASYWISAQGLPEAELKALAGKLLKGPGPGKPPEAEPVERKTESAAAAPKRRPIRILAAKQEPPPEMEPEPKKLPPVRHRIRMAAAGKWFSFEPPEGYEAVGGDVPYSVITLEGSGGRIQLLRIPPPSWLPAPPHLQSYVVRQLWGLVEWRTLLRTQFLSTIRSMANQAMWSWTAGSSPDGFWILGGVEWKRDHYWFLATGPADQTQTVIHLLSSMAAPDPPVGEPNYPEAPGGLDLPRPLRLSLLAVLSLLAWGGWLVLFKLAKPVTRPAGDWTEGEDLLGAAEPWKEHPLAGKVRVVSFTHFSVDTMKVLRHDRSSLWMEWFRPQRPVAAFSAAVIFFLVLGISPPLGPSGAAYLPLPLIWACLTGVFVWFAYPQPKVCCLILDGKGRRVAELSRRRVLDFNDETYRVQGVEGRTLGYISRTRLSRLLRKQWLIRDFGDHTVSTALEPPLQALVRRITGRAGGILGAELVLWEKEGPSGSLFSRGMFRRRLELRLAPRKSRILLQIDPRLLLALCAVVMEKDPDCEHPWLLA